MTKPYESPAAGDFGVGARVSRRATWIAAGLFSFMAVAGLWAPDVRAQSAATDQATPKLTAEICLGCHGQEGFAPAPTPGQGNFPMVLKDRFLGSVHGKRQCVECHTNITKVPHEKVEVKVSCVNCHRELLETAQDDGQARRGRQAERRRPDDRPLHEVDPRAAQQGRSVAHQRHLLQLPRSPLHLSEGQPQP